jgi:hypothetical protein
VVLVHALAGRAVDEEARSALPLERNKPRGLETIAWDVEQPYLRWCRDDASGPKKVR